MTARPNFTVSGSKVEGDVPTVQADLSVAWAASSGGSSSFVTDYLTIDGGPFVLNQANGWSYGIVPADLAVLFQRGTDLSLVDGGSGDAAFETVTGGDFALMAVVNVHTSFPDFDPFVPPIYSRFLSVGANGLAGGDTFGLDFRMSLGERPISLGVADEGTSQPFFDVPAGGQFATFLGFSAESGLDSDVFTVARIQVTVWKLGQLPT